MKIVPSPFVNCTTPFCHIAVFSLPWIGTPKSVLSVAFRARIGGGVGIMRQMDRKCFRLRKLGFVAPVC